MPETRAPVLAEGDQDGNDADEQAETPLGRDREAAGDTGEPAGAGPEVRTPPEQPAAAAPDREPARSASTPDREPARSASTADRPVRQSPPPPVREPAARAPTVPAWQSDYDALARDLGRSRPEPSAYGSNDALEAALNETGELLARIDDLQADHPRADALVEKLAPERSRLQRREGALRDRLEELRAPAAPEVWTGFYGTACDPETNAAVEGLRIVAISRTGRRSQPTATETGGAYRLPVPEDLGWSRILVTNAGGAESTFSLGGVRMTAGSHREKNLCGQ